MTQEKFLTPTGLKKIQDELEQLKNVRRKEVANRIQEAKELGDLSENAEYTEAKNEQAFIEGRINELEMILKQAKVIAQTKGGDIVSIGSTITVQHSDGNKHIYTIVGSNEADPVEGKISHESPLGQAFLGRKTKDKVTIVVPKGTTEVTILEIE
ncbi:MAG: transcription elongation factor GreA [Candidatus Nomurabacteria bacterium]|nr:MAG: transcription elongation factor GreA [Candidatus Nomurabacteria bacterium]